MNYQRIYNQIVERAQTRQLEGYKEKHHVVPKCMGGNNDKSNLVDLTAREHFICHRLLCEIYPNNDKLLYALWLMAIGKQKPKSLDEFKLSSRVYETIRLSFINKITGKSKPSNKGRKVTWGDKIGKSLKGKPKPPRSEKHNQAISAAMKGKKQSPEAIDKRFASRRNKSQKSLDLLIVV